MKHPKGVNRTTVELKRIRVTNYGMAIMSVNRITVELKHISQLHNISQQVCVNRTTVELKLCFKFVLLVFALVLIELQ